MTTTMMIAEDPELVLRHVERDVPNWSLICAPMFARPSRSRYVRKQAPKMTPQMFPIPPRMTMQRMNTEIWKKKSSGNAPLL